ncbi:hypothetical protein DITRI_Ditri18aG0008800 [Diplodiscus trichospermus]
MLVNFFGVTSEINIRPAGTNLFIVQFSSSDARDRILEAAPWHIQNESLIVRKWEPSLKSLEFNMSKLLVWIQSNIPLELFTQKVISYIANALGNPLYMDRFTASQQRLAFAKVCVKLDAKFVLPKYIEVVFKDGTLAFIFVDVPWMSAKCTHCAIFRHREKSCFAKSTPVATKVWVPKLKPNEPKGNDETLVMQNKLRMKKILRMLRTLIEAVGSQ